MNRAAAIAGPAYFALVFAPAFLLGVIRVLFLVPRLGELASVAIELPIMLSVSWITSRALIKLFAISADWKDRAAMGCVAFLMLMIAEFSLSIFGFGRSTAEHFAGYLSWVGALGLAGQFMFAVIPLMQLLKNPRYMR